MTFTIQQTVDIDDYFIEWLLDIIKIQCQTAIKPHKLTRLNDRIVNSEQFDVTSKSFNLYKEMQRVVRSLRYRKVKDCYVIYIPSNIYISNTSIPLSRLSRFVCYGDLQVKGYPILSDTIQRVIANIAKYIKRYEKLFYGGI